MSGAEPEPERGGKHQVTPLELVFDLAFVFAMTQVTILFADDPTWGGVGRGMLVVPYELLRYREQRIQVRHPELRAA